jgi:hypothetical protein
VNIVKALAGLVSVLYHGEPRPPQGIRATMGDQWIEPVKVTYVGQNPLGNHEWLATFDVCGDDVDGLHIDVLPGRTSVALAFLINPEDSP